MPIEYLKKNLPPPLDKSVRKSEKQPAVLWLFRLPVLLLFLSSVGFLSDSLASVRHPKPLSNSATSKAFAKGEIFALNPQHRELLFKWELRRARSRKGEIIKSTWSAPDGSPYAIEVTELDPNGELKRYAIQQLQTNASGAVDVEKGKLLFSWKERDTVHTNEEKITDDFVAPSMIPLLIQKKWKELLAGNRVRMRMAVLPWRETLGFFIRKNDTTSSSRELELEVTPSNPIFSIFAPHVGFGVNAKTKQLIRFHGPSLAKIKVNGKWKDVDVRAIYRYF